MGAWADLSVSKAMATRWRRRQMCVLTAEGDQPAAIRTISAVAAFLETNARPALGDRIALRHPEAGTIFGHVDTLHADGVGLRFDGSEHAVAFAMSAIGADMSNPD